ncbi:hypothetical protein [Halovivax gelatinilyticus]|uniref:hypothetical protein n=1 Tax=Halovivax gelatinilyticus TaxID=2961597 RepID=UPI0020CA97EC|nr:hypothetical protein [Halovivax gelatinilyticus]
MTLQAALTIGDDGVAQMGEIARGSFTVEGTVGEIRASEIRWDEPLFPVDIIDAHPGITPVKLHETIRQASEDSEPRFRLRFEFDEGSGSTTKTTITRRARLPRSYLQEAMAERQSG